MKYLRSLGLLAPLSSQVAAITLLGVLQSYPELHSLYGYVNSSTAATTLLAEANNFTFFAPNGAAIQDLLKDNPSALTEDALLATLQYSLLQGGYPTLSFTNEPQFVKTNLQNATYANVTGGQAVELLLSDDERPTVLSSNKTVSTSPSTEIVCSGGIIHIVDTVLQIPIAAVLEITAAHLEYFISILSVGGFLNTANDFYVNAILEVPDVTYFIPNSAAALANATKIVANASQEELQAVFQYHIVPGMVKYSTDLEDGMTLKTAQGEDIKITVRGEDIFVNSAKVIETDLIVANGVIHVLESLLDRNNKTPPPLPVSSTTIASSTATPSPTSSSSASFTSGASSESSTSAVAPNKGPGGGLSKGAKIGIGVGVAVAGLLALGAIAGFFLRDRRHKRERDSGVWDNQDMAGMPNSEGKYYIKRGTIQRQEDMGLGLHSTGMHDIGEGPISPPYTATASGPPHRPVVPPRSPSRAMHGNEF